MSGDDARGTVNISKTTITKREHGKAGTELVALDHRLKALQGSCIPSAPYLLAIPTKRQYHLSDHQQKEEFKEREIGFKPEERDLQYLSFLGQGWNKTVLSVLKPQSDTKATDHSRSMASASAAPKSAAKKISVADYQKRSSLPGSVTNGSPADDLTRPRSVSSTATNNQNGGSLKRNADTLDKSRLRPDEPVTKKLKPSPQLGPSDGKGVIPKNKMLLLPPPLSPTLPPFVERLLKKTSESPEKARSIEPERRPKPPSSQSMIKRLSQDTPSIKRNEHDSLTKLSSQSTKSTTNGVARPVINIQNRLGQSVDSDTIKSKIRDKSPARPSVMVRIRISRDRRKDVARLLRLPRKRVQESMPVSKPNASSTGNLLPDRLTSKSAEKRPREDDTLDVQRDRKRSKSPALQDRAASKKPRESTPSNKEEVTTPQGATITGTPIAPTSAGRNSHKHISSETGSANFQVSERLEGLQKVQTKYSDFGRTFKKESDKLSTPNMSNAQKKRFIASRIEVTLTFMLSYIIGDEVIRLKRRPPKPEATWGSLFVWMRSVHELVQQYPHLSGLLLQLEAISLMVVWRQRSELAESGSEVMNLEKFKDLRLQHEDAQKKFIKGSARLSVDDLQDDFPKTWKAKARLPQAQVGYKMGKDNLNGDFYLPLTSTSLPIEGVRAGKTLLAEWCRREGVEWVAKLEF